MDEQAVGTQGVAVAAPSSHRARWSAIGAAVAVVLGAGGLMTATAIEDGGGEQSVFVAITPCRVMDTRPAPQTVGPRATPLGPAQTHTIAITGTNGNCTIPADATGVSLNVTVVDPTADSFLTVFPADAPQPVASNLNYVGGQEPVPNAVTVDLSADGKISFYNNGGNADVVADIVGYYQSSAHDHDDRYYTESEVYNRTEVDAHEDLQKFISVDIFGIQTDGSIVLEGETAALRFADTDSDNAAVVNFIAPPDLTPDTNATLRVNYYIDDINCTVSLAGRVGWVNREGETSPSVPVNTEPDQVPGVMRVGGDPQPAPVPEGSNGVALFTIGQPLDGSGLRPGDSVTLAIGRHVSDTCTEDLFITGIEVLYN